MYAAGLVALAAALATPAAAFGPRPVQQPAGDPMEVNQTVLEYLQQLNFSSAAGGSAPQLWFYWVDTPIGRCSSGCVGLVFGKGIAMVRSLRPAHCHSPPPSRLHPGAVRPDRGLPLR